ncbi:MAG: Uncharacterized protein XD64_0471 [Thermotoga sp. 47_83]|jgi:hypothetical protein|uniref:Lipoprotein n=5 Tax=Thermotoga TaxID=2335 RepID=D2C5M0_THEP2|nr:conserved hypothetical protein [Thermotoga petrophila RKU-10]KUK23649.1 MAG: Uncharacterized protein XD57_0229 [Thermotoga petrophila]KUK33687.1 MAG: Uncharacterized protein XD64_0471 [Thermotoga sp. 47_83]MDK2893579.1 hypothetical protein [Thermotoga sp.]MDK2898317.1 hypothetical protein [Thermotoga sp.]
MINMKILFLLFLVTASLLLMMGTSCESRVQVPVPLPKVDVEMPKVDLGFKVVEPTGTEDFFEDFEAYGQGQVAPFGPWKVLGKAPHVEEGVQADKTIGKVLKVIIDRGVFTPGEWTNFILECNLKREGSAEGRVYFRLSEDGKKSFYVIFSECGISLHKFAGSIDMKIAENSSFKLSDRTPTTQAIPLQGDRFVVVLIIL